MLRISGAFFYFSHFLCHNPLSFWLLHFPEFYSDIHRIAGNAQLLFHEEI